MSILDRLDENQHSLVKRPDPWNESLSFKLSDSATGKEDIYQHRFQREYIAQFTARVAYWANDAERSRLRNDAHRALVRTVYGDILAKLHHLQLAVSMGSRDEAMALLSDITKQVEGP